MIRTQSHIDYSLSLLVYGQWTSPSVDYLLNHKMYYWVCYHAIGEILLICIIVSVHYTTVAKDIISCSSLSYCGYSLSLPEIQSDCLLRSPGIMRGFFRRVVASRSKTIFYRFSPLDQTKKSPSPTSHFRTISSFKVKSTFTCHFFAFHRGRKWAGKGHLYQQPLGLQSCFNHPARLWPRIGEFVYFPSVGCKSQERVIHTPQCFGGRNKPL